MLRNGRGAIEPGAGAEPSIQEALGTKYTYNWCIGVTLQK